MSDRKGSGICAGSLAFAIGIVWGLCMLSMGIVTTYTQTYGHKMVDVFASIYYGYGPTWGGAFLGLAWGFGDAFIGTLVIMGVYRICTAGCSCRTCKPAGQGQGETPQSD